MVNPKYLTPCLTSEQLIASVDLYLSLYFRPFGSRSKKSEHSDLSLSGCQYRVAVLRACCSTMMGPGPAFWGVGGCLSV